MSERRYSEEEMGAIFEQATKVEQTGTRQLQRREGMTLAELQAVGAEAGIPADLVAEAARSLDRAGRPVRRTFLGFPIGVERTVVLDRRLNEDEWDRLVVDLRETFEARGVVRVDGSFRQWTNGNLQALVEPAGAGQRIRLRTTNANARATIAAGTAVFVGTAMANSAAILGGTVSGLRAFMGLGLGSALALGIAAWGALRLPGWARLRQSQMDAIAERLLSSPKA